MDARSIDIAETATKLDDLHRRIVRARGEEETEIERMRTDLQRIGENLRRAAERSQKYLEGRPPEE
jgi:hypothetical protein